MMQYLTADGQYKYLMNYNIKMFSHLFVVKQTNKQNDIIFYNNMTL